MEENPAPDSGRNPSHNGSTPSRSKKGITSKRARFTAEETTAGESVDCSGKHCKSCSAALIADCVAICCCPLALVSLLALAFVKAPYLMSKKCLRRWKKKRKCKKIETENSTLEAGIRRISSPNKSDIVFEFGEELELGERESFCAAFEADKVLLELYQVGHLGFGRVSFTEIQSFGKT